jgi:hypothetical protein
MRKIALTLALAAAGVAGAWAEGGGVVYLDDPAALEQLRTANPIHYAQAQKILTEANHLCQPTTGKVEYAKYGAKDLSCIHSFLRTSNPPKREIHFRLDDTRYIALVVLTEDPPRLVLASPPPK